LAHEFHIGLGLDKLVDKYLPAPGSGRGHRPSEMVMPVLLMLLGGGSVRGGGTVPCAGTVHGWRLAAADGQEPPHAERTRPRAGVAARLVHHARRLVLKVAADAETLAVLCDLRFASRSTAFP